MSVETTEDFLVNIIAPYLMNFHTVLCRKQYLVQSHEKSFYIFPLFITAFSGIGFFLIFLSYVSSFFFLYCFFFLLYFLLLITIFIHSFFLFLFLFFLSFLLFSPNFVNFLLLYNENVYLTFLLFLSSFFFKFNFLI